MKFSRKKILIAVLCATIAGFFIFNLPLFLNLADFRRAKIACDENRSNECVKIYENLKKKDPGFHLVRWLLANAYKQNGQFKEAKEEYLWVIDKYPKYKSAYHRLGMTYQKLNDFPKALAAYQTAVELKPDAWESWYGIGAASLLLKRFDEGIKALKKSVELNPDYEPSYILLGANLNHEEKYQEVLDLTQKYLSRNKAKDVMLFQMAVLSAEKLKKDAVAMSYRKAGLEAFPKDYFLNWDLALEEAKTNPADAKKRLEFLKTVNKARLNDVEQSLDLALIEKELQNVNNGTPSKSAG